MRETEVGEKRLRPGDERVQGRREDIGLADLTGCGPGLPERGGCRNGQTRERCSRTEATVAGSPLAPLGKANDAREVWQVG